MNYTYLRKKAKEIGLQVAGFPLRNMERIVRDAYMKRGENIYTLYIEEYLKPKHGEDPTPAQDIIDENTRKELKALIRACNRVLELTSYRGEPCKYKWYTNDIDKLKLRLLGILEHDLIAEHFGPNGFTDMEVMLFKKNGLDIGKFIFKKDP